MSLHNTENQPTFELKLIVGLKLRKQYLCLTGHFLKMGRFLYKIFFLKVSAVTPVKYVDYIFAIDSIAVKLIIKCKIRYIKSDYSENASCGGEKRHTASFT